MYVRPSPDGTDHDVFFYVLTKPNETNPYTPLSQPDTCIQVM